MNNNQPTIEESLEIADKVRSGEYFRDARTMADFDLHNPMSERYVYILITIFSLITFSFAIIAWQGLYPLKPQVPFIFITNDIVEDYPRIIALRSYTGEDNDTALRRYLIQNYVLLREEYDATLFDRNHSAVEVLSNKDVVKEYEDFIAPINPESPISLYQRHTTRRVAILSTKELKRPENDENYHIQVVYNSFLLRDDVEKEAGRYQVDVAFKYKNIKLDQSTGKIEPYGFIVTSYQIKKL